MTVTRLIMNLRTSRRPHGHGRSDAHVGGGAAGYRNWSATDRKSTRLNPSHRTISYAVFCLKKKNQTMTISVTDSDHLTRPGPQGLHCPNRTAIYSADEIKPLAVLVDPYACQLAQRVVTIVA